MKKARILIADDDANICVILSHILESAGYEPQTVHSGDAAQAAVQTDPPSLILMDNIMPGRNGTDVCRTLKKSEITRRIPVVICSSQHRKEDILEALRAGADDFMIKPFTRDIVLRKVAQQLDFLKKREDTERRVARRRRAMWFVSWGRREGGLDALYKGRILDISETGFAFDFDRCGTCTGYEAGTVHPQCLFAPMAVRFAPKSEIVDFVLSLDSEEIIEGRGRIVHVHQSDLEPKTERVGVRFVDLQDGAAETIKKYVDGVL